VVTSCLLRGIEQHTMRVAKLQMRPSVTPASVALQELSNVIQDVMFLSEKVSGTAYALQRSMEWVGTGQTSAQGSQEALDWATRLSFAALQVLPSQFPFSKVKSVHLLWFDVWCC
jgi:hypothetical protein